MLPKTGAGVRGKREAAQWCALDNSTLGRLHNCLEDGPLSWMCLAKRAERAYIPALSALVACTRLFIGSSVSGEGAAQLTGVFCLCAAAEAD